MAKAKKKTSARRGGEFPRELEFKIERSALLTADAKVRIVKMNEESYKLKHSNFGGEWVFKVFRHSSAGRAEFSAMYEEFGYGDQSKHIAVRTDRHESVEEAIRNLIMRMDSEHDLLTELECYDDNHSVERTDIAEGVTE